MTRIPTIVHVAPDADGKRCGKCDGYPSPKHIYCRWVRYGKVTAMRGPKCLRAGKLLADLLEAALGMRELADQSIPHGNAKACDDALAAIDAAGKAAR